MGHDLSTDTGWTAALDDVVSDMLDTRRQIATLEARQEQILADAVDLSLARVAQGRAAGRRMSRSDLAVREVAAELGAAMRVTDRTVQSRMGDAATLTTRFPATFAAWQTGRIDAGHVRVILDAGAPIADDDTRDRFEQTVIAVAQVEAPGRLRAMARAVAAQLDPDATVERQRRAVADRCVRLIDLDDGVARIISDQPASLAYAIRDRLTEMARAIVNDNAAGAAEAAIADAAVATPVRAATSTLTGTGPDIVTGATDRPSADDDESGAAIESRDTRTIDQIRADLFADLLLAGAPAAHGEGDALAAITGHVQVTVPALTAAGVGTEPYLLAGYGPIGPDTALRLAGHANGWDRVLTHPHTGAVLAVDRYRPDKKLRRHLRARDERCRAPGCRRPAIRSDIDHTKDAAKGGATCESNLGHFCRRHHTLKHHTAWRVEQRPGGILEWYSPTGRRYQDRPPSTVRFLPTDWFAIATANSDADAPPAPF